MKPDYYQLQRQQDLTSLKVFLDNEKSEVIKLIELLNLYPYNKDWHKWADNQGYILSVSNKKEVSIKKYIPEQYTITDLYQNTSQINLINKSHKVLIAYGENDIKFIWFLCKDKLLRMAYYSNNKWYKNPLILSCGWKSLCSIIKNFVVDDNTTKMQIKDLQGSVKTKITKAVIFKADDPKLIEAINGK